MKNRKKPPGKKGKRVPFPPGAWAVELKYGVVLVLDPAEEGYETARTDVTLVRTVMRRHVWVRTDRLSRLTAETYRSANDPELQRRALGSHHIWTAYACQN